MQFHLHVNQSHFHKNGFALGLALKQRHRGTRKWPIEATWQRLSAILNTRARVIWRPVVSILMTSPF